MGGKIVPRRLALRIARLLLRLLSRLPLRRRLLARLALLLLLRRRLAGRAHHRRGRTLRRARLGRLPASKQRDDIHPQTPRYVT